MLYSVECGALPSVAWPDRGLSSLTLLPSTRMWDIQRIIKDYSLHSNKTHDEPNLPSDPRLWSREEVARWIEFVISTHQLPTVHLDRFLMNGKALCLMTMDMFVSRVPLGGKLLYKDFQLRLNRALYS